MTPSLNQQHLNPNSQEVHLFRALQEKMQQLSDQFEQTKRENQEYEKQIQSAKDKTSRNLAFSLPAAKSLNPAASLFSHNPTPPFRSSKPSRSDYDRSPTLNTHPSDNNPNGVSPPPGALPQTNLDWLQYMMDERRASEDKMLQMVTQLGQNRSQVDKSIPQVQPMAKDEDLTEYFELFEVTQEARRTPRKAYAATLLPLLNKPCKSLALSLSAAERANYSALKKHLLAQADAKVDSTIQQFWEHRKSTGVSWRQEAAELVKLARRCTPTKQVNIEQAKEEVRAVFVMEQLLQQLPRNIQTYVRERQPDSLEDMLQDIQRYFKAHRIDELKWETRDAARQGTVNKQFRDQPKGGTYHNPRQSQPPSDKPGGQQPSYVKPPVQSQPQQRQDNDKEPSKTYFNKPKRDMSTVKCHNCGQYGHFAGQCIKVNMVSLPSTAATPPVMKQGKIGDTSHLWYMDSGADFCFIAEDLLPADYQDGPPVHAVGALSKSGRELPHCHLFRRDRGKENKHDSSCCASTGTPVSSHCRKEQLRTSYSLGCHSFCA